jgi:hypothetical protein
VSLNIRAEASADADLKAGEHPLSDFEMPERY